MDIQQKQVDDVVVFVLKGRLDGKEGQSFEHRVQECLEQGGTRLVFDCSGLEYINSSGLRVLIMAYQRLHAKNGRIAVCSLKDYISEIFDISGYNKIFSIHSDCAAALEELQHPT